MSWNLQYWNVWFAHFGETFFYTITWFSVSRQLLVLIFIVLFADNYHVFVFSSKVERNHSKSQSKSDSVQFAFSDEDGETGPVQVKFGLALTAKRFSTVKITEIGDSAITDNDSVVFADNQSTSDLPVKLPLVPVLERSRFFRRNVSYSGVKSESVRVDTFGDEEKVDGGSNVNSVSMQLQSFHRSISYDSSSRPQKYLLPFDEANPVEHNYQFKVHWVFTAFVFVIHQQSKQVNQQQLKKWTGFFLSFFYFTATTVLRWWVLAIKKILGWNPVLYWMPICR